MRIALLVALLLALACDVTVVRTSPGNLTTGTSMSGSEWTGRWMSAGEAQALLRREAGAGGPPLDCCPSVVEMVEPEGGKNMHGMYVELYRDGDNRQRFYEVSCRADVENRPCRFMDRRLHNQSRCVQRFSYTYALVRDEPGAVVGTAPRGRFPAQPGSWTMDYIEVRSGCSCVLRPRVRHRHATKQHRQRHRTHPP